MTRRFWISLLMCFVICAVPVSDAVAQGPVLSPANQSRVAAPTAALDSAGGCGWDQEFGTAAQTKCETLLSQLHDTYGIHWDAPTDPAIRLYDFNNRGLRRWRLADAQTLRDALAAWSKALGGVDVARRDLGLDTLTFKLRGQRYMLQPGDLGEYIDAWNEIDLGGHSLQAVDFAHELAHRWEHHRGDRSFGQAPNNRTLWFALKFFTSYDSATGSWVSDGNCWTTIACGTTGRYTGASPKEDFAETASHMVMQTSIALQYRTSARYQFMLTLLPGLS